MNAIQIVADSTCDLEPSLLCDYSLDILPLRINIQDKSYLDGVDITVQEVYGAMRGGIVPTTAQIPYDLTRVCFRNHLQSGQDVVYIAFSSELSGSYAMAVMIAQELEAEFPGRRCAVIDSRGGSGATGLIVLNALKMASLGMDFDAIVEELQSEAGHVEHVFSVADPEWLARGGRIPKLVGYVGSKLQFHPILDVENGKMLLRRVVRGKTKAISAVADEIVKRAGSFTGQLISITHADDLPAAKLLESLIRDKLPDCRTTISHIGGVLGVHIGLKAIGAFCLNRKPRYTLP